MTRYRKLFKRARDIPKLNRAPYTTKLAGAHADVKAKNLMADCFSNHTGFPFLEDVALRYKPESDSRFIERDNLSAFFVERIYSPPDASLVEGEEGNTVDYEALLQEFTESAFSGGQSFEAYSLGTNRVRYLLGEAGSGKTAYVKRIINDIYRGRANDAPPFRIVPVYIDLEPEYNYSHSPEDLNPSFLVKIYEAVRGKAREMIADYEAVSELNAVNPSLESITNVKRLISELKMLDYRVILFIDNLDFYHYYYSRYVFFKEYNARQEKSIEENFLWIRKLFEDSSQLGNLGLNVIITIRSYVYSEVFASGRYDGTSTDVETSRAFALDTCDHEDVVGARLKLLQEAVIALEVQGGTRSSELSLVIEEVADTLMGKGKRGPLNDIYDLGQHGFRSLVQFLSSLNFSYLQPELLDRYFVRQISTLYNLYINNMHRKYSQKQNHFPNMFLVDCSINRDREGINFEEAHMPHKHSYWLKYLILCCIGQSDDACLEHLLEKFTVRGTYEGHVVRHVLGSLCTANEFRCVEYDPSDRSGSFQQRRLVLTARGRILLRRQANRIPFVFRFEYLASIIDDHWLAYTEDCFSSIYDQQSTWNHLYLTGDVYRAHSVPLTISRGERIMQFVSLLEASWKVEIEKRNQHLLSIFETSGMLPPFDRIKSSVLASVVRICRALDLEREVGAGASRDATIRLRSAMKECDNLDDKINTLNQHYDDKHDFVC